MSSIDLDAYEGTLMADPPWDRADADVILRSADKVHFRLHKLLLAIASPAVFEPMFSLPEPADGFTAGDEVLDGLRIVQVTEPTEHLRMLLPFCYPPSIIATPTLSSLAAIQTTIELAQKYDMDGVLVLLRTQLTARPILEKEPMRVFAIACHYRMKEETRLAAHYTLRHAMPGPNVDELRLITGSAYHGLVSYRFACQCAAAGVASGVRFPWMSMPKPAWDAPAWQAKSKCTCPRTGYSVHIGSRSVQPSVWWEEVMRAASAVLRERPFGDAVRVPVAFVPQESTQSIMKCSICSQNGLVWLDEMCKAMAVEVDKATERVLASYKFE